MNRTHSRCLPLEQPIYYSAIILNVLAPLAMFIGYEVKDTDIWKGFYIFWVVELTASLYFLFDAYRRINSQIIRMADGQLRKKSMIVQLTASVLLIIALSWPLAGNI